MKPRLSYLLALLIGFVCLSASSLSFGQVAPAGRSHASVLSQLAKLTASDGISYDFFGNWVAMSGNTVVVGNVPNVFPTDRSWVYVFVRPETGWGDITQTAKLTASDGAEIGGCVAISGGTVVAAGDSGAAYVFVKPNGGWTDMTETARLTTSNGDNLYRVAINGNTMVATSPHAPAGVAYVFLRPAGGWTNMTETAKLTASDGNPSLGSSVALGGNTVVVGDEGANVGSGTNQGAAYVFVKPASGWADATETAKLSASDGKTGDWFGWSSAVSADGTTVAVGVPYTETSGYLYYGTAYVFVKPAGGWVSATENAKLGAAGGPKFMGFGWSVAVDAHGNALVVGAPAIAQYPTIRGHAYLFTRPPSGWKTTSKPNARFVPADGGANDGFGISVAVNSGAVVIGSSYINSAQGAAYVFGTP